MMAERGRAEFEQLFASGFERCSATARRITLDSAVAEELAAEAFVRAWTRWPWLRYQRSPMGWTVRVTTNLALDYVRRGPAPMLNGRPSDDGDAAAMRLDLVHALNDLPTRQRTAVALRYLVGLDESEVAAAMRVSSGTVKTHLHRGRAHLRKLLVLDDPELEVRFAAQP